MCRKSSIVPPTKTAFDSNKFLSRNDGVCTPFGLLVTLKYSKTNQHGDNNVVIPLHANPGSSLCPVQAFNDMCAKIPVNSSDPLFCYLNQGRLVPFDADTVDKSFKKLMSLTGVVSSNQYTMHSFRRGGATFYFKSGVPGELVQLFGNWKSDCYLRYLRISNDTMIQASSRVANALRDYV